MFHNSQNFSISRSDLNIVYGNQTIVKADNKHRNGFTAEVDDGKWKKRCRQYSFLDDVSVCLALSLPVLRMSVV